tara:strand:+ start:83 stop:418 length:336 start_codon:yes stop_codon:yes gene_type:complete
MSSNLKNKKEQILRNVAAQRTWLRNNTLPGGNFIKSKVIKQTPEVRFGDLNNDGILSPSETKVLINRAYNYMQPRISRFFRNKVLNVNKQPARYVSTARTDTIKDKRLRNK